jgi:16S rRNA (cytosine967-C5)-methyltransferase
MAPRKPPSGRRAPRPAGLKDPARDAALRLLIELESGRFPAGGRIEQLESAFQRADDRRLFRSIVSENLRHRLRIDSVLDVLLEHRPLAELPPWIRGALRLGATQILVLTGIPSYAAVNTAVDLAVRHGHRGTSGLVNAVLRRLVDHGPAMWEEAGALPPAAPPQLRDGAGDRREWLDALSLRYSHPLWLVRRWVDHWGWERAERILAWNQEHPDYWLRLGPGESPPPSAAPGWIPRTARLAPGSRPLDLEGFSVREWTIQDGSGILVGWLPPQVRGVVLDLCAAPGTKTGHLLERAEGDACVVALDPSPGRLRRLRRGLERSADRLCVAAGDGRRIPIRGPWDGVLIDAPCSNLGVLRRRIDLKWRAREDEIARLARVQTELLESGAGGVAVGGWLVYSVCTLEPEETTEQRAGFMTRHPGWRPVPLPEFLPGAARGREGEMILVPGESETDGTYAFVLRREGV